MPLNEGDITSILTRNGIPADADAAMLAAALDARGWQAQVEAPLSDDRRRGARARRYRALAFRRNPRGLTNDAFMVHEHRRATGETPEAALRRVMAAVLGRKPGTLSADGDGSVPAPRTDAGDAAPA